MTLHTLIKERNGYYMKINGKKICRENLTKTNIKKGLHYLIDKTFEGKEKNNKKNQETLEQRNNRVLKVSKEKRDNQLIKDISILSKDECCGCSACYNACPVNAINMQPDGEGFLYPVIDNEKCIKCGKCKKTCPSLNVEYKNNNNPECYAMMAEDEVRKVSASGGMFTVLAEAVFKKGGVVCGAAYNEEFKVEHIMIESPEEMYRLRSSKYVQSDCNDIYKKVSDRLKKKQAVLFSGCPCQIAALYSYLGKDDENLLTVDLICHGVPSPKVFKKYLKEMYLDKGKEIEKIDFRDKDVFTWSTEMNIYFKDGSRHVERCGRDPYYRAFLPCLSMRPACPECKYTTLPRQADISIGDFWGIGKYNPELNDKKGTSLVLVNSKKGQQIFKEQKGIMKSLQEMDINSARPRNYTIDHPFRKHPHRDRFFKLVDKYPFDKAVEYSLSNHYDVGLVGLWFGENYGSMVTYYALYNILNDMGLTTLFIDNPLARPDEMYKTSPRKFASEYADISVRRDLGHLRQLNEFCDTFMVGSDQLWNYELSRRYGQMYFLSFVDDDKKKIAYGTSFGKNGYTGPDGQKTLTSENLKRFDYISVREPFGIDLCRDLFGVDAVKVMDPVFLCDVKVYDKIAEESELTKEYDYILAYILDPTQEKRNALREIARLQNKPVYVILDNPRHLWKENYGKLGLTNEDSNIKVLDTVDVKEWIWYIKHSSFVATDSFHGVCFSMIYKKKFVNFANTKRGSERVETLLEPLGIKNRLLYEYNGDIPVELLEEDINYDNVFGKMKKEKEMSIEWLKNALFSDKSTQGYRTYKLVSEGMNKEEKVDV